MRKYGPEQVRYPYSVSEAEIQAEIWGWLVSKGYDARMEVPYRSPNKVGRSMCRIDVVVFSQKVAEFGFEVKRPGFVVRAKPGSQPHRQQRDYLWLSNGGLPVHYVTSLEEAVRLVEERAAA